MNVAMELQVEAGAPAAIQVAMPGTMPESFFERGLAMSAGRDGRVDLVEAHKWFNIAASRGDMVAARHREEVAREMSRADIAAALRRRPRVDLHALISPAAWMLRSASRA